MRTKLLILLLFAAITLPSEAQEYQFYRGADIGWITEIEHRGNYQIVDTMGRPVEAHALLKSLGFNAVRIRVWANPKSDKEGHRWCDLADVVTKARRATDAGMDVMIDFHYSNWWADPSQQHVPQEWAEAARGRRDSLDVVCDSMRQHTMATLMALQQAGVRPRWIQVGNEIPNGFMHPYGDATAHPDQFARLFQVGYEACKSVFPHADVVLHIDNGYDLARSTYIIDILQRYGVGFDLMGWSLYPAMNWVTREVDTNWQRKVDQCISNAEYIYKMYARESMLVEVGMPDADENIAADCVSYIMRHAGRHIHGMFWWEPLATPDFGYAMGALKQYSGTHYGPNKALKAFKTGLSAM